MVNYISLLCLLWNVSIGWLNHNSKREYFSPALIFSQLTSLNVYWGERTKRRTPSSSTTRYFKSINFCTNHCLLLPSTSFHFMMMKEVFLWNAKISTCVPHSITSHFPKESSSLQHEISLKHLSSISYILPATALLFHITLKLSEGNILTCAISTPSPSNLQCFMPVQTIIWKFKK